MLTAKFFLNKEYPLFPISEPTTKSYSIIEEDLLLASHALEHLALPISINVIHISTGNYATICDANNHNILVRRIYTFGYNYAGGNGPRALIKAILEKDPEANITEIQKLRLDENGNDVNTVGTTCTLKLKLS